MSRIRFTIVITCHNQRDFIEQAVKSALSQSYPADQIIVVDDGSTDDSVKVIEPYAKQIELIQLASNCGALVARNTGCAAASGDYLVFLDGDDVFMNWALAVYAQVIDRCQPKIVIGKSRWFSGNLPDENRPLHIDYAQYESFMQKDRSVPLSASALVVEKRAFNDVGGWSEGIFHLDLVDVAAKLGFSGTTVVVSTPFTVFYRLHTANSILDVKPFVDMARRLIAKEKKGDYPGGNEHRFERYAWLGGISFFWMKRALRAGLYKDAWRLTLTALPMILVATARRTKACIGGRQPLQTISMPLVMLLRLNRLAPALTCHAAMLRLAVVLLFFLCQCCSDLAETCVLS